MFQIDNSTAVGAMPAIPAEDTPGWFTDGNPGGGQAATVVPAWWLNVIQAELLNVLTAANIAPDKAETDQLAKAIAALNTYDVPFIAGWGGDMAGEDLAVRSYGAVVAARAFKIIGDQGRIETVNTGANVVVDVEVNGVSIYGTKPALTDTTGAYTTGVLTSDPDPLDVAAGDLVEFKVTAIGSVIKGQKLSFALKGYA